LISQRAGEGRGVINSILIQILQSWLIETWENHQLLRYLCRQTRKYSTARASSLIFSNLT